MQKINCIEETKWIEKTECIVNKSICRTINRFREKPFYYFTESDIHSSLQRDLIEGNSKHFYFDDKISSIHLEYPTNFRYKKGQLLEGYDDKSIKSTIFSSKEGDRGNYDLAILNRDFIESFSSKPEYIKHLINKDIRKITNRINSSENGLENFQKEVLYCIEVKYIHQFNARNKNMLEEVIKDNEKLKLALYNSKGFIRPINLIFCSSKSKERRDNKTSIVDSIHDYIENGNTEIEGSKKNIPNGIVNIFIQSYFTDCEKETPKPIIFCREQPKWAKSLIDTIPHQ